VIKCHFIDILKTFHPTELKKFREFLDSPYFNKRKKLLELFDIITDYYPFFTDENFSRESIYYKLYPGEKYNYGKINEGLSALYQLAVNFIRQAAFENNNIYPDVTFVEELRKRSLKNIFNLFIKNSDSKKAKFVDIDSNLFLKQYLLQIESTNFEFSFDKFNKKEKVEEFVSKLGKIVISLSNFYISEIVALCVNKFNYSAPYADLQEDIFKGIYQSGVINKLSEIIKPFNQYDSYLDLLTYYLEAINHLNDNSKYYDYKQKVFENINKMSIDDIGYHLNCLQNYCVIKKKSNISKEEFTVEHLNLQESILEKKLFINNKSQFFIKEQFLNMITNYDARKNKDKIKNLLNYIKYLHPDFREDMKLYAEAYYFFHNYSYVNSLECLMRIRSLDKTFEEKINNLWVRNLFEMNNYSGCMDKINLLRKNYRSNTILNKKVVNSEFLFLSVLENLIKLKEKSGRFDAEYLKDRIDKQEFIPSREWLIEKCYELYDKPKQIYNY